MTRRIAAVLMCAGLAQAGCNTIAGAGKDIEAGGEKVQDAARDVQRKR